MRDFLPVSEGLCASDICYNLILAGYPDWTDSANIRVLFPTFIFYFC